MGQDNQWWPDEPATQTPQQQPPAQQPPVQQPPAQQQPPVQQPGYGAPPPIQQPAPQQPGYGAPPPIQQPGYAAMPPAAQQGGYAMPPAAMPPAYGAPPMQPMYGQQPGYATSYAMPGTMAQSGVHLTPVGKRLGGYLLEGLLATVTFGIGWLIWAVIAWSKGQTPAKQLLNMRCVKKDTGQLATWGTMFVREIVGKVLLFGLIWLVGFLTLILLPLPIVLDFMCCWDKSNQQLWDKIAGTVVVDDPLGVYA